MTNFYEREQDGTIRIFGVAVHSPQTQFKIFEPENPALFIPGPGALDGISTWVRLR